MLNRPGDCFEEYSLFISSYSQNVSLIFSQQETPEEKAESYRWLHPPSFEMGLDRGRGSTSEGYGKALSKSMTQLNLNEECYSKSFPKTSISVPVPLTIQFFMNCSILYISVVVLSLILHVSSLYLYPFISL